MKKIYQTVVDNNKGNCMQAAVASLFNLDLKDVPNFIHFQPQYFAALLDFFLSKGYDITYFHLKNLLKEIGLEEIKKALKHDNGINGYFYASVMSKTFKGVSHAVIINSDLEVVHDPNPNQLALSTTPEDINYIYTHKDDWYIKNYKEDSQDKVKIVYEGIALNN